MVSDGYTQAISLSVELIKVVTDPEASYRSMAAAGTLICDNPLGIAHATSSGMKDAAKALSEMHTANPRIAECHQQLVAVLTTR